MPFGDVMMREDAGIQHWHRDTPLLFQSDGDQDPFHFENVHDADDPTVTEGGLHSPPYAINVFMPLSDLTMGNGPTEFTLGSAMWGQQWEAEEVRRGHDVTDHKFLVKAGSLIVADYRTIHRGTANLSPDPRVLAMSIWGRDWWVDSVNYGNKDYGGFASPPRPQAPGESEAQARALSFQRGQLGPDSDELFEAKRRRFFWGLVNQWESGLAAELQAEYQAHVDSKETCKGR
eukprot:CAMPEP_0185796040 /NCGR_PEP_ID=MMETSP1174-20130828/160870_1 /TAXON_ID=35687 /ORGANISM="Dictyocha speculum, Strain CCMP1381" /LENGTH=231 /DNA_ID=CAMNT_0028491379 /DNA_START=658 /DNA_END=1350 /DNA_ORIENTATION=+